MFIFTHPNNTCFRYDSQTYFKHNEVGICGAHTTEIGSLMKVKNVNIRVSHERTGSEFHASDTMGKGI